MLHSYTHNICISPIYYTHTFIHSHAKCLHVTFIHAQCLNITLIHRVCLYIKFLQALIVSTYYTHTHLSHIRYTYCTPAVPTHRLYILHLYSFYTYILHTCTQKPVYYTPTNTEHSYYIHTVTAYYTHTVNTYYTHTVTTDYTQTVTAYYTHTVTAYYT